MDKVTPKKELLRQLQMFKDDERRGISMALFAELAGVNHLHLLDILKGKYDLTEYMQRRLDKALREFREGKVVVMQKRNREKYIEYRKDPKPVAKRHYGVTLQNGEFKLQIGLRQRGDYSAPTLGELLNRGQNGS